MREIIAVGAIFTVVLLPGRNAFAGDDYVALGLLHNAQRQFQAGIEASGDPTKAMTCFHKAAVSFQELVDLGFDSPELFLNLGNAHLLADELPQAILAYRRGLRQHPFHSKLWESLEASRDLVGYTDGAARHRPPSDDWPPFLPRPSPDLLLHVALVIHALTWLSCGVWLIVRRRSVAIVAVVLLAGSCASAGAWAYVDYRIAQDAQQPLVVVAVNGVNLRRGNGSLYPRNPELLVVNRGMEGRLVSERGGWVQVQFPGGEVGWLPRAAVLTEGARAL